MLMFSTGRQADDMGAKRRWIPLSVEYPHDKTGTRLQADFGAAGLGVWVAMLTAAKRSHNQGVFSYSSEAEAWQQLGITDPPFELSDFLKVTGHLKKTRKTRRGRFTDVQITRWEDWNNAPRTGAGRTQTPTVDADSARQLRAYDSDSERDIDKESDTPRAVAHDEDDGIKPPKKSDPFFGFWKRNVGDSE